MLRIQNFVCETYSPAGVLTYAVAVDKSNERMIEGRIFKRSVRNKSL